MANSVFLRPGNTRQLKDIPLGTVVHNIELRPGKGGQIARSAGTSAQILATEGKYVTLRLPSGEMRMVLANLPCDHWSGRQCRTFQRQTR